MAISHSWNIRTTVARLGIETSQSGTNFTVSVYKLRTTSATFYEWGNASITVNVNGIGAQGGVSASNNFSGMVSNTWYQTGTMNKTFNLGKGVSTASVTVAWNYPNDSWASGSTTINVPVTPVYDLPNAPTGVTATRNSDTSISVAWTPNPSLPDAPYTSQTLRRIVNGGAPQDTASLSGSAASYTWTGAQPNRKYEFVVRAANSAGATDSAVSNVILTTPAKLASVSGAVVSGGIELTFSKVDVPYDECVIVLEITDDGGDSWSSVDTFTPGELSRTTTTKWTHTTAPSSGTVQYRVYIETDGGTQGTLTSAVTLSNELVLNTPPNAPTNLTSGLVDVAAPVNLSWTHNPSLDGAAQSSRHLQYSTDGGATPVDIVQGDSTDSTYAWTVDTNDFTPGQSILWRVRTAGSQPGTYGAWSDWVSLTLRQSLSVSITSPTDQDTWLGGPIPVAWTTSAAWGSASQVAYRVVMIRQGGGTAYDSGTVASNATAMEIPAEAQQNLNSYTITVTVTDNYGLVSLPESVDISTDFLPPGPVDVAWTYDDDLGQLVFTPTFTAASSGVFDDTFSWTLERSLDGDTYELVGAFQGTDPVPDPLCPVGRDGYYRVTGFSPLGVAGDPQIVIVPVEDVRSKWAWLNYGDGEVVRFGWSLSQEVEVGRSSDVFEVEGEEYPVPLFGSHRHHRVRAAGRLLYAQRVGSEMPGSLASSSFEDFERLAKVAAVCLYRSGDGDYWYARVSDVRLAPLGKVTGQPDVSRVSLVIERVERA